MSTTKNESSPRTLKTTSVRHSVTGEQMLFVRDEHKRYGTIGRDVLEQLRPVGIVEILKASRIADLTFRLERTERIREAVVKFPKPDAEKTLVILDRTINRMRRLRDRMIRSLESKQKNPRPCRPDRPEFVKEDCEAWLWYAELADSRPETSLRALKNTEPVSKYLN